MDVKTMTDSEKKKIANITVAVIGIASILVILAVLFGGKTDEEKLLAAAEDGDLAGIKSLIEKGADVNTVDDDGYTPLHWVVYDERPEIFKALIDAGADVNARDGYDRTPLHWVAGHNENSEVTKTLLNAVPMQMPTISAGDRLSTTRRIILMTIPKFSWL